MSMDINKIDLPKLAPSLETIQFPNDKIQDEDIFAEGTVYDTVIKNKTAEHVSFKNLEFKNVIFDTVSFRYLDVTDVRFVNCDLSNRNVLFDSCHGKYANFRFSNFGKVCFVNSIFNNSDFSECDFSNMDFENTDLQQAQMSGTKLKGIDFSSSNIEGIGVRLEDLAGAIVSPLQAVAISRKLGLVIKD